MLFSYVLFYGVLLTLVPVVQGTHIYYFQMDDKWVEFDGHVEAFTCWTGTQESVAPEETIITAGGALPAAGRSIQVAVKSHNLQTGVPFHFEFINDRKITFLADGDHAMTCTVKRIPRADIATGFYVKTLQNVYCPSSGCTFTALDGEEFTFTGFDVAANSKLRCQKEITLPATYPVGFRAFYDQQRQVMTYLLKKNAGHGGTLLYSREPNPHTIVLTAEQYSVKSNHDKYIWKLPHSPKDFIQGVHHPTAAYSEAKFNIQDAYFCDEKNGIDLIYHAQYPLKQRLLVKLQAGATLEEVPDCKIYTTENGVKFLAPHKGNNVIALFFNENLPNAYQIVQPLVTAQNYDDPLVVDPDTGKSHPRLLLTVMIYQYKSEEKMTNTIHPDFLVANTLFRYRDYCFRFKKKKLKLYCTLFYYPRFLLSAPGDPLPTSTPPHTPRDMVARNKATLQILPFVLAMFVFSAVTSRRWRINVRKKRRKITRKKIH